MDVAISDLPVRFCDLIARDCVGAGRGQPIAGGAFDWWRFLRTCRFRR